MSTYITNLDDSESAKRVASEDFEGSASSLALGDKMDKTPSTPPEKYVFPISLVDRLGMAHYRVPSLITGHYSYHSMAYALEICVPPSIGQPLISSLFCIVSLGVRVVH